jgi:MoaA/NifB/PqqE/SkfB family radical SAM enzyme
MSWELFSKICDDIEQYEMRVPAIYLHSYGEPLLNPYFTKMAKTVKDRGLCRELRTITNGSMLNPQLNQELVDSGMDLVRISIEGLTAESYQKVSYVDFDFDKFLKNIRDLYERSRGSDTKVCTRLVTSGVANDETIERFFSLFTSISDYHFIENTGGHYWPEWESNATDIMIKESKDVDVYKFYDEAHRGVCAAPLYMQTVYSNGIVGICPPDWRMDTEVGNVNTESLRDIWFGDKLHEFRVKALTGRRNTMASCRDCGSKWPDNIDDDAEIILEKLLASRK